MPIEFFNPTPIYYDDLSVSEFQKIREDIQNKLKPEMFNDTTWHDLVSTTTETSRNIVEHLDLKNLNHMITKHMNNFLSQLEMDYQVQLSDSWFNITHKYGFQDTHRHIVDMQNNLSGVYYYDFFDADPESSFLEFRIENHVKTKYIKYSYVPGRIILFHGSLPHRVSYNKSETPRTSFSFNFKIL